MVRLILSLGVIAASISCALGQESGSCFASTVYYNNQVQLQATMGAIQSNYSICSTATPTVPTTTATPTPTCSIQPIAPCFYITGHGESHIEGVQLGYEEGATNPAFNQPAIPWWIDSNGYLHTATPYNGVTMTYYISTESWWGIFPANAPQLYGSDYQPSTCTASPDGTFSCYQYGGIDSSLINVWEYTAAPDSRAFYLPHWGPAGYMQTITLTWQETTCPNLC